jgi:pyridoxal phosphate enzyme (YggS family)
MFLYKEFIKNFEKAILKSRRNIEEVEIIAVSKRKSISDVLSIIKEGQLSFGENQLQEALQKWPSIKNNNIKLHFIGGIQSKKLNDIIDYFDVIHSIDREKLLYIISKVNKSKIQNKEFFIQVNTGNETQKSGITLNKTESFIQLCKDSGIHISGLMCLPPENEHPGKHFQILQSLAKNNHIKSLSMGMTNDYEIALRYGSTHIRIGTAIFGKRD